MSFEAEKPLYRNDYSLTAKSDTGSADITPTSTTNSLINYIGGSTWSSPFQELAWEIEVPESALYIVILKLMVKHPLLRPKKSDLDIKLHGNIKTLKTKTARIIYFILKRVSIHWL